MHELRMVTALEKVGNPFKVLESNSDAQVKLERVSENEWFAVGKVKSSAGTNLIH